MSISFEEFTLDDIMSKFFSKTTTLIDRLITLIVLVIKIISLSKTISLSRIVVDKMILDLLDFLHIFLKYLWSLLLDENDFLQYLQQCNKDTLAIISSDNDISTMKYIIDELSSWFELLSESQ